MSGSADYCAASQILLFQPDQKSDSFTILAKCAGPDSIALSTMLADPGSTCCQDSSSYSICSVDQGSFTAQPSTLVQSRHIVMLLMSAQTAVTSFQAVMQLQTVHFTSLPHLSHPLMLTSFFFLGGGVSTFFLFGFHLH